MSGILNTINQLNKLRTQKRKLVTLLCVLSLFVAAAVFWKLRIVGITMTDEACCGKIEHTHTEECMAERVLVCPLEETADFLCGYYEGQEISVHVHNDECYAPEAVYTCGLEESEEHAHNENCISYQNVLICGIQETEIHHHSEACLPEGGHIHTDECYETVYSCGLEEHHHTLDCYTDPSADVEDSAVWSSTVPRLSGNYAADIVNVAYSQLYYSESTDNVEFIQLENGTFAEHGYTRYGAWAGHPYIDNWSAVFASFCLDYSEIPQNFAPQNSGCNAMMQEWDSIGKFRTSEEYVPSAGDLVFTDNDSNGSADAVGIVTEIAGDNFTAVEGNLNESVREKYYSVYDSEILGYGVLKEDLITKETAVDTVISLSDDTLALSWTGEEQETMMLFGSPGAGTGTDTPLDIYITGVTGSGTTQVGDDYYSTLLELSFSIPAGDINSVLMSGGKYVYNLPEGIILTDALVENGPYYAYKVNSNPLELAFTYSFVENGDGTYSILIDYDRDYVASAIRESSGNTVDNALRFRCYIDGSGQSGEDGLSVEFTDKCNLIIPSNEISRSYDISAEKTGSYIIGNKLRYEVTVSSTKGTPDDIILTDTFTYTGDGTITAPQSVSVEKHPGSGNAEPVSDAIFTQGSGTNVYEMSMTLPQLAAGESYTIVYEYEVTDLTDDDNAVSAYNKVEVESQKDNNSTSDIAEYSIYNQKKKKMEKSGIVLDDYIQWVININAVGSNIAGKILTDEQLANAVSNAALPTSGIHITKDGWNTEAVYGTDYEYVYDSDNKIVGLKFLPEGGSNTSLYNVVYYTLPDVAYNEEKTVTNEANFDGERSYGSVGVEGGGFDKKADKYEEGIDGTYTTKWTVSVRIPAGGIAPGTEFTDTLSPAGHYITESQWSTLVTSLADAWGVGNITGITPIYDTEDSTKITGYSFRTAGSAGDSNLMADGELDTISWQYSATADMGGEPFGTFTNTFSDDKKELPVSITISPGVKKYNVKSIWGNPNLSEETGTLELNYEDEDKTFVWVVEVTPKEGVQEYYITDTLPEGVELIGINVRGNLFGNYHIYNSDDSNNAEISPEGTISGTVPGWGNQTEINGSYSGQTVELALSPANGTSANILSNTFYIVYYCQLKEETWPKNGTVHLELDNSVSVRAGNDDYGEANNTIIVDATREVNVVSKSGVWDKETHLITYTIDINPEADNLLTSGDGTLDPDKLTLIDILTYRAKEGTGYGEAILNLNSVVLEIEEDGEWQTVPNVSWSAHTGTDSADPDVKNAYIEMEVPDSAHLRLTYSYQISSSMPGGIELSNKATLEGHADKSGEHGENISDEDFQTSGESDFKEYQLIKVDKVNGTPLENAVFTAYYWDGNTWQSTEKTYTTDSEGRITITSKDKLDGATSPVYSVNTAYAVWETYAPPNYVLPDNPQKFYFWFSSNQTNPNSYPDDFMLTAADISSTSYRIEAENEREQNFVLPETGDSGPLIYVLGGLLMAGSLIFGCRFIRRKGRRLQM